MPFVVSALISISDGDEISPLPGTDPLIMEGDIASQLVAGVDKFLLRELDASVERRMKYWNRDFSSAESYNASVKHNRERLAHILGVRDERVPFDGLEKVGTTEQPALVGRGDGYDIYVVKGWDYPALIETYQKAAEVARQEHVPSIIHVYELTQPQGHSTSGSHERYKSKERLDCRRWLREEPLCIVLRRDQRE